MLAEDGALGVAQQPLKISFRLLNRLAISGESREKVGYFGDLPTDIHRSNKIEAIARQTFGLLVFEILHALIEFIDLLNWPRDSPFETGFGILVAHLPESCHHCDFRFPNLERKQQ